MSCPVSQDKIKEAHVKTYNLPPVQDYTVFKEGIHIPRQPFHGTIIVVSADKADFHPIFERNDIGGDMDCCYIGQGATLHLLVNVLGALFAVGDGNFAQG